MTTAHRPTFDPARGKEAQRGPAYHQRLQPAHTSLKFRQPGQGGDAGLSPFPRDLRAELLAAEAAHFAKKNGKSLPPTPSNPEDALETSRKRGMRAIEGGDGDTKEEREDEEDYEAKRRRVLEETRDIDADSSASSGSESDDSDSDSEDENAELLRELAKIKAERAAKREAEEAALLAAEESAREVDIALGNPLLNGKRGDFGVKRRWDDDVIFKNQARGTDERGRGKEFVNDLLRSDFHKKFMGKYVR